MNLGENNFNIKYSDYLSKKDMDKNVNVNNKTKNRAIIPNKKEKKINHPIKRL